MIDLEKIAHQNQEQVKSIRKQETRARILLEKEQRQEEAAVLRTLDGLRLNYSTRITENALQAQESVNRVNRAFYRTASGEMLVALQSDYEALQSRSSLTDITDNDREKARQIKIVRKTAETLKDDDAKQVLLGVVSLIDMSEGVKRALANSEQGELTKRQITSYTAAKRGLVYILTPVNGKDNKELATELNAKLEETLLQGKVIVGEPNTAYDPKKLDISKSVESEVAFSFENPSLINGFVLYTLRPEVESESNKLVEGLVQRISSIQPTGFKKSKLEHMFQVIDAEIIDYFTKHKQEEIYTPLDELRQRVSEGRTTMTYEEASRITGKTIKTLKFDTTTGRVEKTPDDQIKVDSLLAYLTKPKRRQAGVKKYRANTVNRYASDNPAEIKQEAYRRLEEKTPENGLIDLKSISYILGAANLSVGVYTSKIIKNDPTLADSYVLSSEVKGRNKKRVFIKAEGMRKFLDNRRYTTDRWIAIREEE